MAKEKAEESILKIEFYNNGGQWGLESLNDKTGLKLSSPAPVLLAFYSRLLQGKQISANSEH